jgi:type II secretory pathway component PulF
MFFSRYWIILLVLTAVFVAYLYYTRSAPWQRRILAVVKKRTPVIRTIIYNQALCRFASGLSILLSAGVSILDSIKIATPLIDDDDAKKELDNACDQIVAGAPLEESLRNNCKFLPDMFIRMVAVGEASGRLDEILAELGENYADEVETATTIVTSLVEPVAILIVGGILGVIVIAILLPIFEMSLFIQ